MNKANKVWMCDKCGKDIVPCYNDRYSETCECQRQAGRWISESDYRKIMAVIKAAKDEYNRGLGTHGLMEAVDKMEAKL